MPTISEIFLKRPQREDSMKEIFADELARLKTEKEVLEMQKLIEKSRKELDEIKSMGEVKAESVKSMQSNKLADIIDYWTKQGLPPEKINEMIDKMSPEVKLILSSGELRGEDRALLYAGLMRQNGNQITVKDLIDIIKGKTEPEHKGGDSATAEVAKVAIAALQAQRPQPQGEGVGILKDVILPLFSKLSETQASLFMKELESKVPPPITEQIKEAKALFDGFGIPIGSPQNLPAEIQLKLKEMDHNLQLKLEEMRQRQQESYWRRQDELRKHKFLEGMLGKGFEAISPMTKEIGKSVGERLKGAKSASTKVALPEKPPEGYVRFQCSCGFKQDYQAKKLEEAGVSAIICPNCGNLYRYAPQAQAPVQEQAPEIEEKEEQGEQGQTTA